MQTHVVSGNILIDLVAEWRTGDRKASQNWPQLKFHRIRARARINKRVFVCL